MASPQPHDADYSAQSTDQDKTSARPTSRSEVSTPDGVSGSSESDSKVFDDAGFKDISLEPSNEFAKPNGNKQSEFPELPSPVYREYLGYGIMHTRVVEEDPAIKDGPATDEELRKHHLIGLPLPQVKRYQIRDPFRQRAGDFYSTKGDPTGTFLDFSKTPPHPEQMSCAHSWIIEHGGGCCMACTGILEDSMWNCEKCVAVSCRGCSMHWHRRVKERLSWLAPEPDVFLTEDELDILIREQKEAIKNAAITKWPLVSKKGNPEILAAIQRREREGFVSRFA